MGDSRAILNVLRNALDFSGTLAAGRRRPPQPVVEESLEAIAWTCREERSGDAWRTGDRLGQAYPQADIQLVTEPDGTFVLRVPLRSLARDWGPPALPPA